MIQGYYAVLSEEGPPAPYVRAFVYLPEVDLGKTIHFLVDTGADSNCLHPRDVAAMGIDPNDLHSAQPIETAGIGGALDYQRTECVLLFDTTEGLVAWSGEIDICELQAPSPDHYLQLLPSLIGRNFLNLCHLSANASANSLTIDPIPHPSFTLPNRP